MADRPILFSAPMVNALLDGRKTQTRRVLKPQPNLSDDDRVRAVEYKGVIYSGGIRLPYAIGDRLWVREAWRAETRFDSMPPRDIPKGEAVQYIADDPISVWDSRYRHARFMPRWVSRLTPTVTDVRVQRLQDVSEADAEAEGIERLKSGRGFYDPTVSKGHVRFGAWTSTAKQGYSRLWNSLHGPEAWDANLWVVALTFTVQRGNIDQIGGE